MRRKLQRQAYYTSSASVLTTRTYVAGLCLPQVLGVPSLVYLLGLWGPLPSPHEAFYSSVSSSIWRAGSPAPCQSWLPVARLFRGPQLAQLYHTYYAPGANRTHSSEMDVRPGEHHFACNPLPVLSCYTGKSNIPMAICRSVNVLGALPHPAPVTHVCWLRHGLEPQGFPPFSCPQLSMFRKRKGLVPMVTIQKGKGSFLSRPATIIWSRVELAT